MLWTFLTANIHEKREEIEASIYMGLPRHAQSSMEHLVWWCSDENIGSIYIFVCISNVVAKAAGLNLGKKLSNLLSNYET